MRAPFRLLTARCRHILFTKPAESSLRSNDDRIVHRPEELVLYTFELRRDLDLAAELLGALVMGETKRDRGFEQHAARRKIGSASCRERVCQFVLISVVAVSLQQKISKPYISYIL